MATSGYCYSSYADDSRLFVKWTRTGTWNSATCGSNIKWELYLDNGDWWYTNAIKCYTIYINGVSVYSGGTWSDYTSKKTHLLASGTTTITHDDDGSKSFIIKFTGWFYDGAPSSNVSANTTFTLDTIPRASSFGTPATVGNQFGSDLTVNISSHNTAFTHKLYYSFGNTTMQLAGSAAAGVTSITFVPPNSLCTEIPTSKTGTITLILRTYSGSTQIGSDTYGYVKLYVTDALAPIISSVTLSDSNSGISDRFGYYVQSQSKLKVIISASGQQGASITSYKTTIGGSSYNGSSIVSGALNTAGTIDVMIAVTDSRGFTTTIPESITVVAYTNPTVSVFTVNRCTSDGTLDDEGTCVKITYNYAITSLDNNNAKAAKLQYLDGTTWADLTSLTAYSASGSYTSSAIFSIDNEYTFRMYVADYFGSGTVQSAIYSSFSLINFNADGESFAVGKASQVKDAIESAIKWVFEKIVTFLEPIRLGKYTDKATYVKGGIHIPDLRDVTPAPSMFGEQVMNVYFDEAADGNWRSILSAKGWNSFYATHELAFNASQAQNRSLYHRDGIESWSEWKELLDSNNYGNYALPLSGGTLTGPVTLTDAQSILGSSGNAILGYNTSMGTGTVLGDGSTATYVRSSSTTNLMHRVGSTNHNILTTGNYGPLMTQNILYASATGSFMNGSQSATLSQSIGSQANGVVLIWSNYDSDTSHSTDAEFNMTFIPKEFVTLHPGLGVTCIMASGGMGSFATKYVYPRNTSIIGSSYNSVDQYTDSSVTVKPRKFVLRYVIGV